MAQLDWSQCPAVESIPGKVSGAWVLKGTRMPVQTIFENLEAKRELFARLEKNARPDAILATNTSSLKLADIGAKLTHRVTHRSQVDDRGNAGEILKQNSRGRERDLVTGLGALVPACDRLNLRCARYEAFVAKRVLEQNSQGVWESRDLVLAGQRV